ncbi:MAG: hypothetical protein FRX49_01211 [Trebouxia sp. A1-2]|nr:MAG: hypothetical protein FRX49_01211 [Trebouxia sp. A1-2]
MANQTGSILSLLDYTSELHNIQNLISHAKLTASTDTSKKKLISARDRNKMKQTLVSRNFTLIVSPACKADTVSFYMQGLLKRAKPTAMANKKTKQKQTEKQEDIGTTSSSWRRAEPGGPQEAEAVMAAVSTQRHHQLEGLSRCQGRSIAAAPKCSHRAATLRQLQW